jgi:hypothetical protein
MSPIPQWKKHYKSMPTDYSSILVAVLNTSLPSRETRLTFTSESTIPPSYSQSGSRYDRSDGSIWILDNLWPATNVSIVAFAATALESFAVHPFAWVGIADFGSMLG